MENFEFGSVMHVSCDERLINEHVLDVLTGMTFGKISFSLCRGAELSFCVGECALPSIDGREYAYSITSGGLAIVGRDYGALARGVMAVFASVLYSGERLYFECGTGYDTFTVGNRMIHVCIFPETTLTFLRKLIRLSAAVGYTHIVLEFWGMLRYDCEPSLAWADISYTKDQIRPIIQEIRQLGMTPIPMFNHLGHAPGSRMASGKHVVLDQNPQLFHLFTPDGWAWDVNNENTLVFLKKVREELYELFGDRTYFHLGLDEAYFFARNDELRDTLCAFLTRVTREVEQEGARAMLWMDMFLPKSSGTTECCMCSDELAAKYLAALAPSAVLVDWQYWLKEAPIPSTIYLKDKGFDIMGAPWYEDDNVKAHVATCVDNKLFGVMLTTWHKLNWRAYSILHGARFMGYAKAPWSSCSGGNEETSTLIRKTTYSFTRAYDDCGWCEKQISVNVD